MNNLLFKNNQLPYLPLWLYALAFFTCFPSSAFAGCSIHNHNCLHGAYPNDPALGDIPRGDPALEVTTNYGNGQNVDLNQHVQVPEGSGPYVATNPDGNPVKETPLGAGADVLYHGQQQLQYTNATAAGTLTSTEGQEQADFSGNVAEGTYNVAVHNYDLNELGNEGTYTTTARASGRGHFSGPSLSHVNTGFVQEIQVDAGALASGEVSGTSSFEYYSLDFDPHAQGVYVIPDEVWNIGGITDSNFLNPAKPFQFEYANPNRSEESIAVDFLQHILPEASAANQELGGFLFAANNGRTGLTLSVGSSDNVNIGNPTSALRGRGGTANSIFHTHQNTDDLFSAVDLAATAGFGFNSYLINKSGTVARTVRAEPGVISAEFVGANGSVTPYASINYQGGGLNPTDVSGSINLERKASNFQGLKQALEAMAQNAAGGLDASALPPDDYNSYILSNISLVMNRLNSDSKFDRGRAYVAIGNYAAIADSVAAFNAYAQNAYASLRSEGKVPPANFFTALFSGRLGANGIGGNRVGYQYASYLNAIDNAQSKQQLGEAVRNLGDFHVAVYGNDTTVNNYGRGSGSSSSQSGNSVGGGRTTSTNSSFGGNTTTSTSAPGGGGF